MQGFMGGQKGKKVTWGSQEGGCKREMNLEGYNNQR